MDMRRIEEILESAKDPSEREEKMTVYEALETTPGKEQSGTTREDAFNFSVDDLDRASRRGFDNDEKDSLPGRRIKGRCPECGRKKLRAKKGRSRTEIYCENCEKELLQHDGIGTVVGVKFLDFGGTVVTTDA